jgi:hypothetical protein
LIRRASNCRRRSTTLCKIARKSQLQTQTEINQIDERYFRDQTKPQIDLVGNYTSAGLAGTANEITRTSNTVNPNYWRVSIKFPHRRIFRRSLSIRRRRFSSPPDALSRRLFQLARQYFDAALPDISRRRSHFFAAWKSRCRSESRQKSGGRIANPKYARANRTNHRSAGQKRSAIAAFSAEARLASALAARQSAEQLYESEQRQFRAGTTTFYLVLQRQTELLSARGRELQSQTDLNKAISEFQRSTGTTLSANNVTVTKGANLIKSPLRRTIVFNSGDFGKGK